MRNSEDSKIVRAFAILVLAAIALIVPKRGGMPSRSGSVSYSGLDLMPNITRGLNLIGFDDAPIGSVSATVKVYDGGDVLSMPLEDYIVRVTAAEMPASYELEALKAQAVAARTFTVKHLEGEARCKRGYTVCTDPNCCQAFMDEAEMHELWGADFDKYYEKIRTAVHETEGQVLTSEGELVTALYHSSSGGRTENCEAVFAVALPYLVSVESEGEESSPEYKSVKTYSVEEFVNTINSAFPDAFMTDPKKDVDVWERTESGRITLIRLGGTVRTGDQLRKALKLRSTNAQFTIDENTVTITCLGFGHGVGMSQCGANAMAKQGASFDEILTHYYTGVDIEQYSRELSLLALFPARG